MPGFDTRDALIEDSDAGEGQHGDNEPEFDDGSGVRKENPRERCRGTNEWRPDQDSNLGPAA